MFCFWITVPDMSLWIFIYDYILAHDTNVVQALLWMHQDEKHAGAKWGQHWATSTRETNNIIPNCSPGSYSSWQVPDFSPFLLPCVKQSCSCRYIDYGRMKLPNWPEAISFSSQEKFWTSRSFCLQVSLFKSSCITCMEVRAELRLCFLLLGYGLLF